MKKYNVYGMGNALVDMEFEVSDSFLKENEIEKGLMTLVDEDRQKFLLEKLGSATHKRACGGSAANTIIGATQLGAKTFYSCKVASDETGQFYSTDLASNGVSSNIENGLSEGQTGKCLVMISDDAERTMNTFLGTTATYSDAQLDLDALSSSEWLYIEGYLVTGQGGIDAAVKARKHAKSNDVKVALTFSDPGIVGFFKDGFKTMIGDEKLDLLFCNEGEAMSYTDTQNIEEAYEKLKDISHTFAITLGEKGALVFDGNEKIEVITNKVTAVDTNGAGDVFAGAFMYGITNGLSYAMSAKLACACASRLVTQFGPRLTKEQAAEVAGEVL